MKDEDPLVQDVYLFESQEIDIEFSDGVCVTLSAQEVLALRDYVYRVDRVSELYRSSPVSSVENRPSQGL